MMPSAPVCHLIVPVGASLTMWVPRDDRPGQWAAVSLEPVYGLWEAAKPNNWTAALRSPLGFGSALLLPSDTSPPPRAATIVTSAPADIRLALGDAVTFWFQAPSRARWYNRTLMANANSSGIHLTAGHGGRGRRGALRLCMVDRQQPPAASWDAAKLNVPAK